MSADPTLETGPPAYLERRNPAANCARFYRVAVEGPDLLDQVAVVRQWGRIGAPRGQVLRTYHADQVEADQAAARLIAAKRRKGYQDGPLPPRPLPMPPEAPPPASWPVLDGLPLFAPAELAAGQALRAADLPGGG